jgi:hypothetical protein
MGMLMKLTKTGRAALKHPDGLEPEDILILEVLQRLGDEAGDDEVDRMCGELQEYFGSAEKAVEAIRSGHVEISWVDEAALDQ